MAIIADIYGTLKNSTALYDSDNLVGYFANDMVIEAGELYVAPTDIKVGSVFAERVLASDSDVWVKALAAGASSIATLTDVNIDSEGALEHGKILAWDSDTQKWVVTAKPFRSAFASTQRTEYYKATAGQTVFPLGELPYGITIFARNGIMINPTAFSDSDKTLTYDPAGNAGFALDSDDDIIISYLVLTSLVSRFPLLSDVSDVTVYGTIQDGDPLIWNKQLGGWVSASPQEDAINSTQSQTDFVLSGFPLRVEDFFRNGIRLPRNAWSDSDNVVKYISTGNGGSNIDSDDSIQITYFK